MAENIPLEVVIAVWKRDAGICQHPGCTSRGEEIHHIIFRSLDGKHVLSNLVLLCAKHHNLVHDNNKWRLYEAFY